LCTKCRKRKLTFGRGALIDDQENGGDLKGTEDFFEPEKDFGDCLAKRTTKITSPAS